MNKNKLLRFFWKVLLVSQLPLYVLLVMFIISFFTGAKNGSETMNSLTDTLLSIVFISFCISCFASVLILLLLNRNNKKALTYSVAASVVLVAGLYILYYYGAHLLFIAIPFVIVLYHALMFSVYSRIFISETSEP
ncbi:MAG: hypothetical protein ABI543_04820 [Ignavibacteria bacterium]